MEAVPRPALVASLPPCPNNPPQCAFVEIHDKDDDDAAVFYYKGTFIP